MTIIRLYKTGLRDRLFRTPLGSSPEAGSALLITIIVLAALMLIGTIATQTSTTEEKIAGYYKLNRMTYYDADGATELASELLEQNIDNIGFDSSTTGYSSSVMGGLIHVNNAGFWTNSESMATTPSDTNRDFYLPEGYAAGEAHTNFTVGGQTSISKGAGSPASAGYKGLGKGGGGGAEIDYDITTQRVGSNNSESIIRIQWRHVD